MARDRDRRVVVVGSGRTGLRTARLLAGRGHDVVIVERNPDRVADLAAGRRVSVIEGDATDPAILRQADLDRADVVAAMTDTMGTNFTVCRLAERVNPDLHTVMRSVIEDAGDYADLVDEVVFPERAGARVAVNAIEADGDVRSVEDTAARIEVLEVRVAPGAPVADHRLSDVGLPDGCVVVSNVERTTVVRADTTLRPGETYVIAVDPHEADRVRQLFRG
jgi:trk system potassium uptake protein TrkA